MSDLIERQAAIDTVRRCSVKEVTPAYMLIDRAEAMIALMRLPSAQPEIISCEECKYRDEKSIADGRYWCKLLNTFMYYCSEGEMRNND